MSEPRSVTEIFSEAAACTPEERPSFLNEACGENATLRAKVEQLLDVHDGQGVLDRETADLAWGTDLSPTPTVRREGPGTVIDRYRLLQLIGQGGFGSVFRAEQQTPVRRHVALKIIKLGMDTEQVIARFEAERQALAMMDHPSIAKVFDAGATETGRPYFVMELVKGVPITQYCDSTHATIAQRLALFIEVCHAVQHAHQKGIIHRDLKPSNVLVALQDNAPVPKVIDFGIAKATNARLTERTLYTEYRQFIGTPEYMSPEQAEMSGLDVDTRSDIYSLGVLLYELLTGTTPFDSDTLRSVGNVEIQRIIREEEPSIPSARLDDLGTPSPPDASGTPAPSGSTPAATIARQRGADPRTLGRRLRGDLDWIVMKALDKDRTRRYETADALAADLERHLTDEPVIASPPSASYRLRKLVRRHRRPVAAAVVVLLLLVLGTVGTSIGMIRAVHAEARARDRAAVTEAVTEFLNNDLLAAVAPSVERGRGRDVLMREVLDVAADRIDEASREGGRFVDRPLVQARVRTTLSETYRLLGVYPAAEEHARSAVDLYRQALGDTHPDTLAAIVQVARVYRSQGRYDDAEPLDREVLEARRRAFGPDHPDTLEALGSLGAVHLGQNRHADAEPLLVEALEQRRRVLGPEHADTLVAMSRLALLYQAMARYDEAETLCVDALRIRERTLGPENPATLGSIGSLAAIYRLQTRPVEAQRLYERSLAIQRRVMGPDHPNTLWTMVALAEVLLLQDHAEEAERLCFGAHDAYVRGLGAAHPATLAATSTLAEIFRVQGRPGEAADLFRLALEACREGAESDDPAVLNLLDQLAAAERESGRDDAARRTMRELIAIRCRAVEGRDASAPALNAAAWLLVTCEPTDLRDPKTAIHLAERANRLTARSDPAFLDTLALAYHLDGQSHRAVELQRQALDLVPPDATALRAELERRLVEFEAAAARGPSG